jgi:hypothetical protein
MYFHLLSLAMYFPTVASLSNTRQLHRHHHYPHNNIVVGSRDRTSSTWICKYQRKRRRIALNAITGEDSEAAATASGVDEDEGTTHPIKLREIPSHLITTLDLAPLMTHVSSYACTKRGRESIGALVSTPPYSTAVHPINASKSGQKLSLFGNNRSRRRRGEWYSEQLDWKTARGLNADKTLPLIFPIAQSAEDATLEYKRVRQAMDLLASNSSLMHKNDKTPIPLPPMFQLFDGVSSTNSAESDDDEWIDMCLISPPFGIDIAEEVDLETILQAEQVTKLLLDTYEWGMRDDVTTFAPEISNIVKEMNLMADASDATTDDSEGAISSLRNLYQILKGAVEIVRAGPNLSDLKNQYSYQFRLAADGQFDDLDQLRQKEQQQLQKVENEGSRTSEKETPNQRQLKAVREEISVLENLITRKLINAMMKAAPDAQRAMHTLARLDVIFARAAFGCEWNGAIPKVGETGSMNVIGFVHPVLALEKRLVNEEKREGLCSDSVVVPVDLLLPGKDSHQALLISGPNSGGKTLSLKSFGLVSIMAKLALPIPLANPSPDESVIVDYFDYIKAEVGDNQSVVSGESTLMARLNACSSLIQAMTSATTRGECSNLFCFENATSFDCSMLTIDL